MHEDECEWIKDERVYVEDRNINVYMCYDIIYKISYKQHECRGMGTDISISDCSRDWKANYKTSLIWSHASASTNNALHLPLLFLFSSLFLINSSDTSNVYMFMLFIYFPFVN